MIRIIDHEGNGYGVQAEITRKKGVNGEKSLTGTIYTNEKVLNGIDRGWKIEFDNEMYAFTFALPKDLGNQIELDFDAVHEFFYDMSKSAQNELLNDGSHTFRAYLDFIFGDTSYNYSLDANVQAFEKQTFGQRNRLDLFYDVINTAGVEFSVSGSVVRILERVGNDLSTVVKKGFNLNELRLEKNIGNFVTYQKGFGAWNDEEDHSKGRLEVEYLSPLAEIYGQLDADPIVDERYSVRSNLLARLQNNVEGSYQISVQIDMEDLTRAGYEYKHPHEGDSIMAINDDLGFQRKVRIVSYETDFDVEGNILDHRITCNSVGMVEKSISSSNSIRYAINELQNDLELARQQITEARISADGKSMNYYGPIEPSPDDYKLRIGDIWFDSSGEDTIVKVWNGVEWRKSGADVDAIRREVEQAQQDIAEAQATADNAITEIEVAVDAAGFTSLSDSLTGIQQISQSAQANAENALAHSLNAISDASTALSNSTDALSQVANIDVRVDEVEGTLELKADKQEVDTLSGIVDTHTLDIQANAEGLALKANQDTVDTLAGTVSSLGTEVGVVAGKVSSRVWNTDIETAIDGIEVGGRNLILDSGEETTNNNYQIKSYYLSEFLEEGEEYTFVMSVTPGNNGLYYVPYLSRGYAPQGILFPSGTDRQVVSLTFKARYYDGRTPEDSASNGRLQLFRFPNNGTTNASTIHWAKIVKGNKTSLDHTLAPEDTLARFDHIETEWTQTFDSFSQTVSGIDGRVSKQEQTVSGMQSVVYDPETGLSSLNTQLADLVQVAVTGEEMTGAISVLEDNLNLRLVAKDKVITQINASTEGILLQADKVQALGDVVVDGKLTITDEFIAPNAQINGAKIADATIGSAKIANLDADKISGNTTNFISSNWNNINIQTSIDDRGINIYGSDQYRRTLLTGTGFHLFNGQGAYNKAGAIGYFKSDGDTLATGEDNMNTGLDRHAIGIGVNNTHVLALGYNQWESTNRHFRPSILIDPLQAGRITIGAEMNFGGGSYSITGIDQVSFQRSLTIEGYSGGGKYNASPYHDFRISNASRFRVGSTNRSYTNLSLEENSLASVLSISMSGNLTMANAQLRSVSGGNMAIESYANMYLRANGSQKLGIETNLVMGAALDSNGYAIIGTSDERWKDVHGLRVKNDLENLMKINYVDFTWKDPARGGDDLGFVAQQVRLVVPEIVTETEDGILGYNTGTYINFIGHAVQQLALKEENTNKIASQALQLAETVKTEVDELREELCKANNRITELERKVA